MQVADFPSELAVTVASPSLTAVTLPSSTVAILSSEVVQVMGSFGSASAGVMVAVNVSVSPMIMSRRFLLSVIPETGARTTIFASAVLSPAFAVIVASPFFTALTLPDSTDAMDLSEEVQVIVLSVALSGRTEAVNVSSSPTYSVTSVFPSLTSDTATKPMNTVTVHSPFFPSAVAVILVVPSLTAVTRPDELTDATEDLELDQVTSFLVAVEGETVALS